MSKAYVRPLVFDLSYEEPVDTSKDMVDRGITPYYIPGGELWKQEFVLSPNPHFQILGERMYIPETWEEYYKLALKAVTEGGYGFFGGMLYPEEEGHKN